MKVLITGGNGFIGKNLIEFFSNKYEILAPTHNELDLLNEDKVSKFFDNNKIDIVIHCAVKPGHRNAFDPSGQLYHNTRMFFNLTRNDNKYKKMIYLGSGLVYDQRYYQPKMKEEYFDKHVPEDEGGFSKYVISKYIECHLDIIELRVFGVFGKYEDYAIRFISNLICKAIYDLPLTMNQNRKFDYVYIDDLSLIIDHFISNTTKKHNIFNITPDKSEELYSIAQKILSISGKKIPIVVAKEGFGSEYSGDNGRIRNEIKSLRFQKIDNSIQNLYHWYSKNKQLINKEYLLTDK
jgi:GDP-L-fucose synthase